MPAGAPAALGLMQAALVIALPYVREPMKSGYPLGGNARRQTVRGRRWATEIRKMLIGRELGKATKLWVAHSGGAAITTVMIAPDFGKTP